MPLLQRAAHRQNIKYHPTTSFLFLLSYFFIAGITVDMVCVYGCVCEHTHINNLLIARLTRMNRDFVLFIAALSTAKNGAWQ